MMWLGCHLVALGVFLWWVKVDTAHLPELGEEEPP